MPSAGWYCFSGCGAEGSPTPTRFLVSSAEEFFRGQSDQNPLSQASFLVRLLQTCIEYLLSARPLTQGASRRPAEIREYLEVLLSCESPTPCLERTAVLFPSSIGCVPQSILSEALLHLISCHISDGQGSITASTPGEAPGADSDFKDKSPVLTMRHS